MAHQPFTLEILTPEGLVYSGEVEFLSTRTESGAIGIYARHQPMLALVRPGELHVQEPGAEMKVWAQGEGYLQVAPERVLLLVEEAMEPSALDREDLERRLADAQERAERAEADSEEERRAERDERRARAFLAMLGAAA